MRKGYAPIIAAVFLFGCADLSGGDVTLPTSPITPPDDVILPSVSPEQVEMAIPVQQPQTPVDKDGMILRLPANGSFEVSLETVVKELDRDFTFEVWLKLDNNVDQMILSAGDGFRFRLDHTVFYAEVGSERLTGMPFAAREWYHVAVVVQKDEARLYINGGLQDREFVGQTWNRPTATLVLGHQGDTVRSFQGLADNLRVVRDAIYEQPQFQPTNHFVPVDNVLFAFSFDSEAPGGVIPSVAGPSLDGQLVGSAGLTGGHI